MIKIKVEQSGHHFAIFRLSGNKSPPSSGWPGSGRSSVLNARACRVNAWVVALVSRRVGVLYYVSAYCGFCHLFLIHFCFVFFLHVFLVSSFIISFWLLICCSFFSVFLHSFLCS